MYFREVQFIWEKNEIKNLIELYVKYKMPIAGISPILNRTELSIKNKLIELNLIDKGPTKGVYELIKLKSILSDISHRIDEQSKIKIKDLKKN